MVVTALNLFGSRSVKVVSDLAITLDHVMASGTRPWTRHEHKAAIVATLTLGDEG